MNLDKLWADSWKILEAATKNKQSPMRLGTVGTQNGTGVNLRTVVLRQVSDGNLIFYTDFRSPKVAELQANHAITWLFYDSTHQIQLRLYGKATILHNCPQCLAIWNTMPDFAKKDYLTSQSPSSHLVKANIPSYLSTLDASNFCIITSEIYTIDYLKLQRDGHIRAKFERNKMGQWKNIWLVP